MSGAAGTQVFHVLARVFAQERAEVCFALLGDAAHAMPRILHAAEAPFAGFVLFQREFRARFAQRRPDRFREMARQPQFLVLPEDRREALICRDRGQV